MSKYYKETRQRFRNEIKLEECYCILSGLKIKNINDLSIEHYCPLSRVSYQLSTQEANLYPAYKIINNIKGNLLPCEFEEEKIQLYKMILYKNKLKDHDRKIVEKALDYSDKYIINPCFYCVLLDTCSKNR